jgi:hypothetical protein
MATGPEPLSPSEQRFTAEDVDLAERRAADARERAARSGLSAARSIDESARSHERVANIQDVTVEQRASHDDVHRKSAARHRQAAADDRKMAERKRNASEADLSVDRER